KMKVSETKSYRMARGPGQQRAMGGSQGAGSLPIIMRTPQNLNKARVQFVSIGTQTDYEDAKPLASDDTQKLTVDTTTASIPLSLTIWNSYFKEPRQSESGIENDVPGGPVKAQEHFVKYHRDVPVAFNCGRRPQCGKKDKNPRSILSHHVKCKIGKGRKLQLWSQQEIERLHQVEVTHKGAKTINKLIAADLGNKSHIQVAEKRRQLRESATPESTEPLAFLMTASTMTSVPSEIAESLKRETARQYGPAQVEGEDEITTALRSWVNGDGYIDKTVEKVTAEVLSETASSCDKSTHYIMGKPITIGSMLLRLYPWILTKQLARACRLNPRQRGFIQSPGCSENLMVLKYIIEQAKWERKHIAVLFVDIAKAFDSVSHDHIVDVLRQWGLDSHVFGVIQDSYADCHTSIEVGNTKTPEITIKTGVKQGGKVAALTFADDLVLLSNGWEGMTNNLSILEKFCKLTGLTVQAKKCHSFLLTPTHDSYTVNNCQPWTIQRTDLHMIGPEESEKYLGVRKGPWTGISKPDTESQLQQWIQRIDEAPLKLIYRADHVSETSVRLARLDGLVKRAVKAWLRLPHSTCGGLLYSWRRDGGMGLLKLADSVPSIQVRRIQRVAHSEDPNIRQLMSSSKAQEGFVKAWKRAGGTLDTAPALTDPFTPSVSPIDNVRIARHNKICDILVDEVKKLGWETHKESKLHTTKGELRKPDIIFVCEDVAIVVNVTVRWEFDSHSLANAASEKVAYYQNLEQQVHDYTNTQTVHFFGFPVGARGKWHSQNNMVLQLLGVTKGRMKAFGGLVSRRALLYSLDMLDMFGGGTYSEPT
uniref:Reverse transcriptase domain-containing protein n=1 Tax=Denticeps clupeoides TaxID=299321 RepID=A0AAY4BVR2_9TELE